MCKEAEHNPEQYAGTYTAQPNKMPIPDAMQRYIPGTRKPHKNPHHQPQQPLPPSQQVNLSPSNDPPDLNNNLFINFPLRITIL